METIVHTGITLVKAHGTCVGSGVKNNLVSWVSSCLQRLLGPVPGQSVPTRVTPTRITPITPKDRLKSGPIVAYINKDFKTHKTKSKGILNVVLYPRQTS